MSTHDDKSRDDYMAELAVLGEVLINQSDYPKLKIPFVPCADALLVQARDDKEIKTFYDQYFIKAPHKVFTAEDAKKFSCAKKGDDSDSGKDSNHCLPPGCTTLGGIRGSVSYIDKPSSKLTQLFIGDVVWVYWLERMGIFQMYAKLVKDFATEGRYPIANNNLTPVTMEVMVRQLQMGTASSIGDRVATYRRVMGWTTPIGKKMDINTEINTAFNTQFHQFIMSALKYYESLRLAQAIRQTTSGGASAATRVAVAEALQLLKESFRTFSYGRNSYNTLNAIVLAISTLDLIRTVRDDIGVSSSYVKPSQYISSAYAKLVEGKPASDYKPNRYMLHLDCAEKGRDLLLDIEALDTDDVDAVGTWLENKINEERIETYRKAYRDLTKIDLADEVSNIEQQA